MIKIDENAYYKIKDLTSIASARSLTEWIRKKKLKGRKVGRDYIIAGIDLKKFIEGEPQK